MSIDPVLGSFVWVASSLAFLGAGTALVRILDARGGAPRADGTRESPREPAAP